MAREKGLEPLADILMKQVERDPESCALRFVNEQVTDAETALAGARDIVAEIVNEHKGARNIVRNCFANEAVIISKVVKGKEDEGVKYRDYFDSSEYLKKCPSHRMLAMRRGEKEGFLKLSLSPDDESTINPGNGQHRPPIRRRRQSLHPRRPGRRRVAHRPHRAHLRATARHPRLPWRLRVAADGQHRGSGL